MTRADLANAWADDYAERVPERTLEMARLHVEQGYTYSEIATRYGVSRQYVHQLLSPLGLVRTFDRATVERIQLLSDAHARIEARETTLTDEAAELGYANQHSLRTQLHSIGLKVRLRPDEPEHGTAARYHSRRLRCRCEECRRANREATAALAGREPPRHGTLSGYRNYRCKCKRCKEAGRVERRTRRAEKRRQKEAVE